MFEEALGRYESKSLEIKIGSNVVLLRPKGTVLIGTIGRVDIIGYAKEIKLIMADKSSSGP